MRGSISAEAAGWNDGLEFREVEVADRVQGLGGGAVLEVLWQSFQPGRILTLQRRQLGDSVAPALGTLDGRPENSLRGYRALLTFLLISELLIAS